MTANEQTAKKIKNFYGEPTSRKTDLNTKYTIKTN